MWWFCLTSVATLLLQSFAILAPLSALVAAIALQPRWFRSHWRVLVVPMGILLAATVSFEVLAARQRGQIAWIQALSGKGLAIALLGPASFGRFYEIAVVGITIGAIALLIRTWSRSSLRPTRFDFEILTISFAWAALPTAILIAVSLLVKPIYVSRYVTASAPGLAIVVAFLSIRALDMAAPLWTVRARAFIGSSALAIAVLVIFACSIPTAQGVSENIKGAAQYLAVHVGPSDETAFPDRSLTAGITYYLRVDDKTVASWPQLTEQQPQIEECDLRQDGQTLASASNDVWLVDDGSVPGTPEFIATLKHKGYVQTSTKSFVGIQVIRLVRIAH